MKRTLRPTSLEEMELDDRVSFIRTEEDDEDPPVKQQRTIGVPLDTTTYGISPLTALDNRKNVQREDGKFFLNDDERAAAGYSLPWLLEQEERHRLVEQDPTYKFLTLVAGHSNMPVEKLWAGEDPRRLAEEELAREHGIRRQLEKTSMNIGKLRTEEQDVQTAIKNETAAFNATVTAEMAYNGIYRAFVPYLEEWMEWAGGNE